MMLKDIAWVLNQAAKAKGISQERLAKTVGISRVTMSRYLLGHKKIPSTLLPQLCYALDISIQFGDSSQQYTLALKETDGKAQESLSVLV